MDFLRMCVFLGLCMTLLVQVVFSSQIFDDDTETEELGLDTNPDTDLMFQYPDTDGDLVDPSSPDYFSRLRRQFAPSSSSYRTRRLNRGRLAARRLYNQKLRNRNKPVINQ